MLFTLLNSLAFFATVLIALGTTALGTAEKILPANE
jgi:hypothetical protein